MGAIDLRTTGGLGAPLSSYAMASTTSHDQATVVEVAPDWRRIASLLVLLAALVLGSVFVAGENRVLVAFIAAGGGAALLGAAAMRGLLLRRIPATIAIEPRAVVIESASGRERRVFRSQVDRVELVEATDGVYEVRLVLRRRVVRLEVADRALGRDLVRRIRGKHQTTTYWARDPRAGRRAFLVSAAMVFTTVIVAGRRVLAFADRLIEEHLVEALSLLAPDVRLPAVVLIVLSLLAGLAGAIFAGYRLLSPTRRITLGSDGLHLRWWRSHRFIAFADVDQAGLLQPRGSAHPSGVELRLRDGRTMTLTMQSADASALLETIDAVATERAPASPPLWLSDRGERSLRDWVAHLRRPDAAGLRDQAPSKDDLFRVVEDGSAQPIERASAAIALGTSLSDDDRQRLAEITEGVAAPKLRVVLEHTADTEDEALAAMLEQLETRS